MADTWNKESKLCKRIRHTLQQIRGKTDPKCYIFNLPFGGLSFNFEGKEGTVRGGSARMIFMQILFFAELFRSANNVLCLGGLKILFFLQILALPPPPPTHTQTHRHTIRWIVSDYLNTLLSHLSTVSGSLIRSSSVYGSGVTVSRSPSA